MKKRKVKDLSTYEELKNGYSFIQHSLKDYTSVAEYIACNYHYQILSAFEILNTDPETVQLKENPYFVEKMALEIMPSYKQFHTMQNFLQVKEKFIQFLNGDFDVFDMEDIEAYADYPNCLIEKKTTSNE